MEGKRFSESLVCHLVPGEVADRADRAARLQADHDQLAERIAAEQKSGKAQLARIAEEQHRLLEEVRTRQGYRPVECERKPDFEAGVLRTVRLDTGEVVRQRPLTPEERQTQLFVDHDYPDEWEIEQLERAGESDVVDLELPDRDAGGTKLGERSAELDAEEDAR